MCKAVTFVTPNQHAACLRAWHLVQIWFNDTWQSFRRQDARIDQWIKQVFVDQKFFDLEGKEGIQRKEKQVRGRVGVIGSCGWMILVEVVG